MIAFLDDLGIVLDYDHGILIGAQALQDLDQTAAVARMQADGRLVEHVERIDQRRADRGGEIDAFQFAAGKRARLAIEGEIFQTDADEIGQAPANFIKDEARYLIQGAGRLELLKKALRRADAHGAHLRDVFAFNPIIQRVGFEPAALALGAHQIGAVARQQHAHVHAVAFALQAAKPAADAFVFAVAFDNESFLLVGQFAPGFFRRDFFALAEIEQAARAPRPVEPRLDRAIARGICRGRGSLDRDRCRSPGRSRGRFRRRRAGY